MDYQVTAKRIIKGIASPILDACGIYDAALARRVFNQPTWVVMMYHRVIDERADDPFRLGMCIDQKHFAKQIEYYATRFTPISLIDAVRRIDSGRPLPRDAVSVTFDDGYQDFKDIALPILKRYQCPSTVFVTTGGLEDNQPFWWDRVIDAVSRTDMKAIDTKFLSKPAFGELSLRNRHRRRSLVVLQNLLWNEPADRIEQQVDQLCDQLGVTDAGRLQAPRMGHEDIRQIAEEGVELGAHCEQHVDMRKLSLDEQIHELKTSRRILQELTGQPIDGFAYPGGRQNDELQKLVARTGFSYAASTVRGINRQPYDKYSLRRFGAPDTGTSDFKRCLATAAGASPPPVKFQSVPWP